MSIRSRRTKPRPGRLDAAGMEAMRLKRFQMDDGRCRNCGERTIFTLPPESDRSMHLAHVRGKRMWGDSIENTQTECGKCHRAYHQCGPSRTKPVPRKPPVERGKGGQA